MVYVRLTTTTNELSLIVSDAAVQAELDESMTVRELPLAAQGLPESYIPPARAQP